MINIGGASGNCMNPVVVCVPALITNDWKHVWIYLIAEFLGTATAAIAVHIQHIKVDEKIERSTIIGTPDDLKDDIGLPLLS